jgi:hypothetical protein
VAERRHQHSPAKRQRRGLPLASNGTAIPGCCSLGNPGPSWHVKGIGDFNGDDLFDFRWQNDSGEVAIWELNGTNVIGTVSLSNPGPNWHAKGPAISTPKATPTSSGRTTAARSLFGK